MAGYIVEDTEDLKGILDIFDKIETVEGNKVSDQGSISVPKKYAGQRPLVAIFPESDDE